MWQVWVLPLLVFGVVLALAIPIGLYMARVFDGRFRPPSWLRWIESRLRHRPAELEAVRLRVHGVQRRDVRGRVRGPGPAALPAAESRRQEDARRRPRSSTRSCSFLTNTNLQHYSGEVHLSYFSQLFFICWKQALSPMIGMAALVAIIRGLRGDKHMGNFYVDLWRGTAYVFVPLCLVVGVLLMASGVPMTLEGNAEVDDAGAGCDGNGRPRPAATPADRPRPGRGHRRGQAVRHQRRRLLRGQQLASLREPQRLQQSPDPASASSCLPVASLVMFGRMLNRYRDAAVIFGVMLVLSVATVAWAISLRHAPAEPSLDRP